VSRCAYYARRQRPPSATATKREALAKDIREVHVASDARYGAVWVQRALQARGTPCHRNTVAKVSRAAGLRSKMLRKFRVTTTDSNHAHPVVENVWGPGIHGGEAESVVGAGIQHGRDYLIRDEVPAVCG
jgi:hypothetical protein